MGTFTSKFKSTTKIIPSKTFEKQEALLPIPPPKETSSSQLENKRARIENHTTLEYTKPTVNKDKISEWPPFIQDITLEDDFDKTLEADLQDSLDKAMNQILFHTDENDKLLEEYKNKILELEKENVELIMTRDNLRQELLESRRLCFPQLNDLDANRSTNTNTIETNNLELKQEILKLKSQNQDLHQEHVKKCQKFKLKIQKIKADYSARIFELQGQLKESMDLVRHANPPSPLDFDSKLPSPLLLQIQELKIQLESKNQLILDLSMQLQESHFQVATAAE